MFDRLCLFAAGAVCLLAGCAAPRHIDLTRHTGGSAFLFHQFQSYDGKTGRPLDFATVAQRCATADVVLLGERHGDAVCNQLEAQLLYALLETRRPLALAMEFFEADQQAALDAYLDGRLDEPGFIEQSHRPKSYLNTHRPLIELCRAARVPVIAANTPRRLVKAFRKSGKDYAAFRASLGPADRQWLPPDFSYIEGDYRTHFAEAMGVTPQSPPARGAQQSATAASQPADRAPASRPAGMPHTLDWKKFYLAQLLWDEAMSDAIARYRRRYPRRRVMLVVGGFHVENEGGTFQKLRKKAPRARIVTLAYRSHPDGQFAFDDEDRGAGDVVIYGLTPPKPEHKPTSRPASQPASQPAATQPAEHSAPTSTASLPASRPAHRTSPHPAHPAHPIPHDPAHKHAPPHKTNPGG